MKKILILLLLLSSTYTYSQIVESFDDGNFTTNPIWYGDTSKFEIIVPTTSGDGSINASAGADAMVLRSKQSQGDAVLTTQNTTAYGEWRFSIADGYNWSVSSTNDYYIILMSNDSSVAKLKDGAKNFNGYFLRFKGGSANDDFSLFKQTGTTETEILNTSYPGTADGVPAVGRSVKITRSDLGEWKIYIDDGFGISASTQRGATVVENSITTSSWFGITTNIANPGLTRVVYFDNLYIGPIVGDTVKPILDSVEVLSNNTLILDFSEDLDQATAENVLNYSVNNSIGNPTSAVLNTTDKKKVTLTFATNFSDGIISSINVSNVTDLSGNIIISVNRDFTYFLIKAVTVSVVSSTELDVTFSQVVNTLSAQTMSNYFLDNGMGNPIGAGVDATMKTVRITFANNFVSGTHYILNIKNVTDVNSNPILETNLNFTYYEPQPYDIVINEIMADPSPVVMLPDAEYIELFNTSAYDINLKNWSITTGTTVKNLPDINIAANGYLLLCHTSMTSYFQNYGTTAGVFTSTTALTNGGTVLKLKSDLGMLIDSVSYADSWYQDAAKKNGGWSLEKIDPLNNCGGSTNWISSNDYKGGTPAEVNSVKAENVDVTAPFLISVLVIDSNSISLTFSEIISPSNAALFSNYVVNNGIGNPDSVIISLNTINLTFSASFAEGVENIINIGNISDYCNNLTTNLTDTFTYFVLHPYDVVINELMPDPSPIVALPNWEYIELYNRTNHKVDMTNWSLTVGSTNKVIPNAQIEANGYLIICSNFAYDELSNYGNTVSIYNIPALINTGQTVTIYDNNNSVMSQVTYSDAWYGEAAKKEGGWSLEAIDPDNTCGGIYNWKASVDERGGTPGTVNSVLAVNVDTVKPELNYVLVYNDKTLLVSFSEVINSQSAASVSNYSVSGYSIDSAVVDGNDGSFVFLYFNHSFAIGVEHQLNIQNIYDQCDNLLLSGSESFTYNKVYPYDLVINEIMADEDPAVGLPKYEYLELYNRTSHDIDLIGWTFTGSSTKEIPFAKIQAGGYLLLCNANNVSAFQAFGNVVGITSFSLANTGQSVTIKDYYGEIIHSVAYTDKWYNNTYKAAGGWSLELIDPNNPCGEMSNWTASSDIKGGTPGAKNSVYAANPDLTGPALSRAFVYNLISNDTLKVWFNEPLKKSTLTDKTFYTVDNGFGNPVTVIPQENQFYSVLLVFSSPFSLGTIYTLTVKDSITDCAGNKVSVENSCRFAIPDTARPKDIVINEILFDPKGDGVDFVELYNNSDRIVSLKNLKFTNRNGAALEDNVKIISSEDYLFFPGEFKVVTTSPEIVQSQYTCPDLKAFVKAVGMPTYSNTDGTVVLVDTWMNIIDEVTYTDKMHYALLVSADGVSLERINYNRASDDETNWHSAAENVGFATPGYKNSQYSDNIENTSELLVTPEIFSPDNDGFNDVLNISYKMDNSGYDASISIYDSKGRLVRKLVQNELLAMDGVYSWDGLTDARTKAGIGIYIIYFEAFDLNGNVIKRKEHCVLATKL